MTDAFGSWTSPVTAALVAGDAVSLSDVAIAGDATYWVEGRAAEEGRRVVVRADPDAPPVDVTPDGFSARTRVHEYGGGAYIADGDVVVFANDADQRLYRCSRHGGEPTPITPDADGRARYADGAFVPGTGLMVWVRERHEVAGVTNEIVALPVDGSREPWIVAGGRDFYSSPRPSRDGRRLAWTCWDHPAMPWDGQEAWLAELDDDATIAGARLVAGGPGESVQQPAWDPSARLHVVSDRTGWWNLYRADDDELLALEPMDAEFGGAQWTFGLSCYDFLDDGRILCFFGRDGTQHAALLDPASGELLELDLPYTTAPWDTPNVAAAGSRIAFIAGGPTLAPAVVALDVTSGSADVLREGGSASVDDRYLSVPAHIDFAADDGATSHALVYPPTNPDADAPDGAPPLIIDVHGGPTGAASAQLDLETQYWTSRGFAVAAVNYGGSTGYGREYRERLRERWGVVDVADCVAAARELVRRGDVDPARVVIRGGSAGGYTTLCALTFHPDVFAAGASHFGIGDLEDFGRETHKFESRYLESLIGPPDDVERYRARSPIRFADLLSRPVILFQGLEDAVVPPAQAEAIVGVLEARRLPYAYLAFEGEQHGFRRSSTIERVLEAELAFYGAVLGFDPAGDIEPIDVRNLD